MFVGNLYCGTIYVLKFVSKNGGRNNAWDE
jgi:hypothetical protein